MWVNDKHLAIESMRSNQPVNKISFELRVETTFNVNDLRCFAALLKHSRKKGFPSAIHRKFH